MILLLDTSTPMCQLTLVDGDWRYDDQWEANRELAKGLLEYLKNQLVHNQKTWSDISGIGIFQGPGSFTGLRIGATILNTIADSQHIPIVGTTGEMWQNDALQKLSGGKNEKIVLPFYGSEPHITQSRK